MLTLKWIVGLFCLLYPTRVEGVWHEAPHNATGETLSKSMKHADQMTCGTSQALIKEHVI